jgi:hypothetical protein
MDPPRLKAPLFQMQPRKRETDDRRRVLNLADRGGVQGDSKDDGLTVHSGNGEAGLAGRKSFWSFSSFCGGCTSTADAQPHCVPSFICCSPGRTKKKQPLSPLASLTLAPRNQAVLLQVCLIVEGVRPRYLSITVQTQTPVQVWELQNPRRQDAAAESLVATSQSVEVQHLRPAAEVLES